jgi:hypothetical protein
MVLTDKGAVHCVCKDRFVVHHGTPGRGLEPYPHFGAL